MISYLPSLPDGYEDNAKCQCENCGTISEAWELFDIENFHKVFKAGAIVPAGVCDCGGLSFLLFRKED